MLEFLYEIVIVYYIYAFVENSRLLTFCKSNVFIIACRWLLEKWLRKRRLKELLEPFLWIKSCQSVRSRKFLTEPVKQPDLIECEYVHKSVFWLWIRHSWQRVPAWMIAWFLHWKKSCRHCCSKEEVPVCFVGDSGQSLPTRSSFFFQWREDRQVH